MQNFGAGEFFFDMWSHEHVECSKDLDVIILMILIYMMGYWQHPYSKNQCQINTFVNTFDQHFIDM